MKVSGRFAAVLVAASLVVGATAGVVAAGSEKSDSEVVAGAKKRLKKHYAGTDRDLPTRHLLRKPGKNVWVIPCAVAAEGCAIPANAIEDAGVGSAGTSRSSTDGFDPTVQSNGDSLGDRRRRRRHRADRRRLSERGDRGQEAKDAGSCSTRTSRSTATKVLTVRNCSTVGRRSTPSARSTARICTTYACPGRHRLGDRDGRRTKPRS